MTELRIVREPSPFDTIRRTRPNGSEYWSARDLMPLMGYTRWETFEVPLNRAMRSTENINMDVTRLFQVSLEKTDGRPRTDFHLSRFAAYLVTMNGDPNKREVADAQAYFASQTRFAELVQQGELPVSAPAASLNGSARYDDACARYDLMSAEFNRVITSANVESPTAAAMAATLQNLSGVMLALTRDRTPRKAMARAQGSVPSAQNGSRKALPPATASAVGAVPDTLKPFVSKAGEETVNYPRARNVNIDTIASMDDPLTHSEFRKAMGLAPCKECGNSLSSRMNNRADLLGVPAARKNRKNVFPAQYWLESYEKYRPHLDRLHADHVRNHNGAAH